MMEDYWSSCTDSYVGGIECKYTIPVEQLEIPPEHLNIRGLEEKIIVSTLQFYLEMLDPDKKMTLCAMPQNMDKMPADLDEVKNRKFWMVNGQHSVEACKRMAKIPGAQQKYEKFKAWDCFVV